MPSKVHPTVSEPPSAVELLGAFDGVCSPADLEDFPEDGRSRTRDRRGAGST
jgi:hypothetical protein